MTTCSWLGEPLSELAEGPRWSGGRLTWVDILGGLVHHWDPLTFQVTTDRYEDTVSVAIPRVGGGEVVAVGASICLRDPGGSLRILATLGPEDMRCNDGVCGPDGALYVGTMRRDGQGREGQLFRVGADGGVDVLLNGLGISNGIGFDSERDRVYYIDSRDGRVDLLDLDDCSRTPFVSIDQAQGLPDGLALDAEGGVWVAVYGSSQVQRFSPDGLLTQVVEVPASNVTSCTFGGSGLTDLFIATAREHLGPEQRASQPLAGGVFRVAAAGVGVALTPFKG